MKRRSIQGVTLIELMIGIVLSLVVSFAVNSVLDLSVQSKRRTQASGDMNQVAGYAQLLLDRAVRSAGSGFAQETYPWGCEIQASRSSSQILPATSGLPAPFGSVTTGTTGVFRLAPVLIGANQTKPNASATLTSDALIIMSGQSGQAEVPLFFADDIATGALTLSSGVGMRANDVVLLADRQRIAGSVAKPCIVTQVSSAYTAANDGNVALSGTYYAATINSNALTALSIDSAAFNIGNTSNNPPLFQVIGVGDSSTLYSYDLLQFAGTSPIPLADGVFELKALYGVDTTGDGTIDSWQSPSGTYALSSLMAGTQAAAQTINQIKALRIGLILRANRVGKASTAPTSLALFSTTGSGLTYTRTLTTAEQNFRYQTVEFTVPVVNTVLRTLP